LLTDLTIKNIAIIDALHISFASGLTVLTGETGAGKSIIIDAVGLILGGRASTDLIRTGEEEASVEALFDISALPALGRQLAESGIDCDTELLVKRSISRSGKNRLFINGSMATLNQLSEITPRLINIYGQHESQTLLRPENHLRLLDSFAGLADRREEFTELYERLRLLREQLARLEDDMREADRRLDLLSFQSEEIAKAALTIGEDEELQERRLVLAHAEKLATVSHETFERLYGGDGALLGQLRRINAGITELAAIDHTLQPLVESLENGYLQLEDAAISLRDYASHREADPGALQQAEDRLDQIGRLQKKYGASIEAILQYQQQIDAELDTIREQGQDRGQLEDRCAELAAELSLAGAELTSRRSEAASRFAGALEGEIRQLAMKNARIEISIEPLPEPRPHGFERLELLFSPNAGEPPRPLAKIASGGELSRLMLAIKQVLPESDVPSLIFDEVDTGIGGAVSELVGKKLKNVAACQQVLCITHLPQVAVYADQHLRVEKLVNAGRTVTRISALDPTERVSEIARMLAGSEITDSAKRHAAELLAAAR